MSSPVPVSAVSPRQRLVSFRGILPFLRPHRGLLAFWLASLAVSSTATLYLPIAIKGMIDQGFSTGTIDRGFLGLAVVVVALSAATGARFFFISLLGERVIADLRRRLYAHLLSLCPGGGGREDNSALLEGNHHDRREAKVHSLNDVKAKKPVLEKLVKHGIALRDK